MVLIVMAAVVVGVIAVEEMASKDFDYSQGIYVDNQASFYFHSAIKVAEKLLKEDNTTYDSENDIWASLPPFKVNDSTIISMQITPLNAKIDINDIVNKNLKLVVRTQKAAEKIFKDSGENVISYFKSLLEWIGYKGQPLEGYEYGYHPIRGPFYSLKEIDFVRGLNGFSSRYHNIFTVENTSGKININFASKDVIEAYLPEIADCAEEIIKYRQKEPFKNITQIRKVICISDKQYLSIQPYITTQSYLFSVTVDVDINNMHRHATVLIQRKGGMIKVLKYFEGKGYYE